tara:strand:- start:56 stop:178 length:123 start_codon:yes stop_codon:yes gene_type:complete
MKKIKYIPCEEEKLTFYKTKQKGKIKKGNYYSSKLIHKRK